MRLWIVNSLAKIIDINKNSKILNWWIKNIKNDVVVVWHGVDGKRIVSKIIPKHDEKVVQFADNLNSSNFKSKRVK